MNRSLQAILALVVSLTGAMLAVTWVPSDDSRPPADAAMARRRPALPCGFVTGGQAAATGPRPNEPDRQWPQELTAAAGAIADWNSALVQSDTARKLSSALNLATHPWPAPMPDHAQRVRDRQLVEAEYAAAQLAAAELPACPLVTPAWNVVATNVSRVSSLWTMSRLPEASKKAREQVAVQSERLMGKQFLEALKPLVAHVERQHERLALREALLQELDRRFFELFQRPAIEIPAKPSFQRPNRKIILAASEALKSISRALDAAADRLEAASREDVAELHTPVENREEKR